MIKLRQPLNQIILAHIQAAYPLEACGLLAGRGDCISHLYMIENILHSPTAFEMDPRQQIQAMIDAEDQGLELLALYHSHPTGPQTPSKTDVARAYYPELIQLIISLHEQSKPTMRAFTIVNAIVAEINLLLE